MVIPNLKPSPVIAVLVANHLRPRHHRRSSTPTLKINHTKAITWPLAPQRAPGTQPDWVSLNQASSLLYSSSQFPSLPTTLPSFPIFLHPFSLSCLMKAEVSVEISRFCYQLRIFSRCMTCSNNTLRSFNGYVSLLSLLFRPRKSPYYHNWNNLVRVRQWTVWMPIAQHVLIIQ